MCKPKKKKNTDGKQHTQHQNVEKENAEDSAATGAGAATVVAVVGRGRSLRRVPPQKKKIK